MLNTVCVNEASIEDVDTTGFEPSVVSPWLWPWKTDLIAVIHWSCELAEIS